MTPFDLPAEWAALPGEVVLQRDDGIFGEIAAFRAVHTLGRYKYGAHTTVALEFLGDGSAAEEIVVDHLDRFIRPWAYVDRIRWPYWEPFPRLERWLQKLRGLRERRS